MTPPVAVAVISWNTRELLRTCLESLLSEGAAGLAEVWVVDNASEDGSAEMVAEDFPAVSLIASESNLGFGRAVNEVAARSAAEWIAPANADVRLEPGALAALLRAGRTDDGRGAIAPRLIVPGGATQHSVHPFPSAALAVVFNLGLYRVVPGLGNRLCIEGWWDPESARDISWAHGAFLLVRRTAFEQIGGFDEEQWLYAEDIDLGWRLRRAGWRIRYEPAARVRHEVAAATQEAFGGERSARHVAATYAWMARRRGMALTWFWAAANAAGGAVRAALLTPLARLRPTRFSQQRDNAAAWARMHARGLRGREALLRGAPNQAPPGVRLGTFGRR